MDDNPLLVAAGRFHGHVGPFLAIGLRMGLLANERMGRAPMDMKAEVRVVPRPPRSCTLDGIQYASGCTLGKASIRVEPDPAEVAVEFRLGPRTLGIRLRQDFLERMERELEGSPEKAIIDYAFQIMDTPLDDLFEVAE